MSYSNAYNFIDRGLHRAAFCTPFVQKALSELENDLFRRELERVESSREVFITGLPRAGTTLLLELLYATGEFRTYTYRDMPFVLAPLLWSSVSGLFRRPAVKSARAHEDGMEIGFDSPEAFEEVVWMAYLPKVFERHATLATLSIDDVTKESAVAIRASVRKVLALSRAGSGRFRYLSKNNANIARMSVLTKLFPSATVVVAFREPRAHAASLDRQHRLFAKKHAADAFARQYMRWIGHFEFGANFKPIDFGGWLNGEAPADVDETFWMRYWIAAYSYALEHRTDAVCFVDFDKLLAHGEGDLRALAAALGVEHEAALVAGAAGLRAPTTRSDAGFSYPADVLQRAQAVHAELSSIAL